MTITRNALVEPVDGLPRIARVVEYGGVVHLCGVTPDPVGDVVQQTRQVLARIDALLAKGGTDKSRLLTAQVWLADMSDFERHNAVWNEWVDPANPPARACVQAALWKPGMRVEIMVSAARPQ